MSFSDPPGITYIQLQHLSERKNITSDAKLIEHKNYTLLCIADANPPSKYIWDGHKTNGISNNALIDFPDVKRKNNGTYICTAMNEMQPTNGTVSAHENNSSVNINILCKYEM